MITRHHLRWALLGLWASTAVFGSAAQAQDSREGGNRSTLTFSLGATTGKNLDLDAGSDKTTSRLTGRIGYLYEMRTRQTQLRFNAAVAPETDSDGSGTYPSFGLNLTHEAPRTKLTFGANYVRARVTDQSISVDEAGTIVAYDVSGERSLTGVSAGIEGGIGMPLGYNLNLSHSEVDYFNLPSGSDYAASKTDRISGRLRADISPMTQASLNLGHSRYASENADQTRRITDSASIGLSQRLDAITDLGFSIGRQRVETTRLSTGTKTKSGATFGLDLTRDDQLGSYTVSYDQSVTENGQRDSVLFGRSREGKFGKFSGTLGLSKGEEGDPDVIGSLNYTTDLPRDRLRASLSRAIRSDDDGNDVVSTRLTGGLSHTLSSVNALNFGVTASTLEYTSKDKVRLDASVGYQHLLTQDISLQAGMRFGFLQETDKEDADSQSLFLTLTREIEFLH